MSQILDKIKLDINSNLSKYYKAFKTQMSPEDWREFEFWFWKIRPHLKVDLTKYSSSNNSETSGPAINITKPADDTTQLVTNESENCKDKQV